MTSDASPLAMAAFDICDALLFKLVDLNVMTTNEAVEVLKEVRAVHLSADAADGNYTLHQQVAGQIDRLVTSRTSAS